MSNLAENAGAEPALPPADAPHQHADNNSRQTSDRPVPSGDPAAPDDQAGRFPADYRFPPATLIDKISMTAAVLFPFVGCVVAIALLWTVGWMGWLYLGLMVGGWLSTGLGVTLGYHRLLTHNSFDTYRPVRVFFMALGALSIEGSPIVWCAIHRRHHEKSDRPGDPHSPHVYGTGFFNILRGLWHAQLGWLFTGYWSEPNCRRYVPDLLADPLLVAVDRLYYVWVIVSLVLPAAIAGLVTMSWFGAFLGLLWGGLVRVFITHHITWSINSICHVFGSREFETDELSTNNLLCGLLGHGEGWHNNHHAFPTSARHGLRWWQIDVTWYVIKLMEKLRLAWNVRLPSERTQAARRLRPSPR